MDKLQKVYRELVTIRDGLSSVIDEVGGVHSAPLFTSRISEMPTNSTPFQSSFISLGWTDWPELKPEAVTGITIHHTMSHAPLATARYCVNTKGYPTTQYHIWISQDDGFPAWQLVPFSKGLWHDHTGRYQTTLSIGLAGRLHEAAPPAGQLVRAAYVAVYLMNQYSIKRNQVQGHCDRYEGTVCPGWDEAKWRSDWDIALTRAILEDKPQ